MEYKASYLIHCLYVLRRRGEVFSVICFIKQRGRNPRVLSRPLGGAACIAGQTGGQVITLNQILSLYKTSLSFDILLRSENEKSKKRLLTFTYNKSLRNHSHDRDV